MVVGLVLVGGLVAVALGAPFIPPAVLTAVAVGWNLGLLAGVVLAFRWMARRWGRPGAASVSMIVVTALAFVTGVQWKGRLGTVMPCRRNWTWLPSYLLRSSPLESVSGTVGGVPIKICYGSPRLRGRRMVGSALLPYGKLWRTGANEPTTIRAAAPIMVGRIEVASGLASLYTIPGPETWEVVVNRATLQWGIESEYPAETELGREIVEARFRAPLQEAFELRLEPSRDAPALTWLVLAWDRAEVRIPLTARQTP